jgi:hypothetical protein
MGYWSNHPLGGDSPLDQKINLFECYVIGGLTDADVPESFLKGYAQENDSIVADVEEKIKNNPNDPELSWLKWYLGGFSEWKDSILMKTPFDDYVLFMSLCDEVPGLCSRLFQQALPAMIADQHTFVIPFLVADQQIRITDPELSQKVKEMIGDGGAVKRGYGKELTGTFDSPADYAEELRNMWDDLMSGDAPFEGLGRSEGLVEKITDSLETGKSGSVNVD